MALNEFMAWFQQAPRPGFTKATVSARRVSLEERRLGSSSIIIRMSAIRKLGAEAADNGLLAPELAQGISRVKSVKSTGIRVGNWLSQRQAQALLGSPDVMTVAGLRDRAILAVLLGCGLRRSEVAALTFAHVQQRDGRWCIVDLAGKHGRVRTAPMPAWVILHFADGSTRELSGRRYFLLDLFSGACGGGLNPDQKAQLELIRQCVAAEEPGGGRIIEAMQSLLGTPGEDLRTRL